VTSTQANQLVHFMRRKSVMGKDSFNFNKDQEEKPLGMGLLTSEVN